jgi:hypothetical protein
LKLYLEAHGVGWRIFPVQPKLDTDLDDLRRDADDTNYPERISHLAFVLARKIQNIRLNADFD